MAGLWWMTVTVVFLLSAGSLDAVDQNKLAQLIQGIKEEYPLSGMFSLAVSIESEDPDNLKQLFKENPNKDVQKAISEGAVYKGERLVIAKVKQPEHAEFRVLKDLNLKGAGLLVIYSYASSCPTTCTNLSSPFNIVNKIKSVTNKGTWSKYAFVFEKVFKPNNSDGIEESKLIKALENLGTSGITLAKIFRCYKPVNSNFECTSCSSGGKVAKQCIDYKA